MHPLTATNNRIYDWLARFDLFRNRNAVVVYPVSELCGQEDGVDSFSRRETHDGTKYFRSHRSHTDIITRKNQGLAGLPGCPLQEIHQRSICYIEARCQRCRPLPRGVIRCDLIDNNITAWLQSQTFTGERREWKQCKRAEVRDTCEIFVFRADVGRNPKLEKLPSTTVI